MNTQSPSFYQRVIDKTKGLAFQSQFIAQNVDKRKAALMQANPNASVSTKEGVGCNSAYACRKMAKIARKVAELCVLIFQYIA